MLSILRRLSISSSAIILYSSIPRTRTFPKIIMDSSPSSASPSYSVSQRLKALTQQLRSYNPPTLDDDEIEERKLQDTDGKVVSQVGFAESVTPIAQQLPERFKPKRAAVLVCLFEGDAGEFRVILTKRSSRLSTHSGEIALPGGKADEADENDAATATREAHEEIGLVPSQVTIVAVLEPFLSKHLVRVIPVIGILNNKKEFKPTPNEGEVDEVFDAPLEIFLKDENRRSEEREFLGCNFLVHYFDHEQDGKKYLIWGLTAGILVKAASVVYQKPPAFLEQNLAFKVLNVADKNAVIPN